MESYRQSCVVACRVGIAHQNIVVGSAHPTSSREHLDVPVTGENRLSSHALSKMPLAGDRLCTERFRDP